MTDNVDLLLNGGVFDPRECISSEEIAKKLVQSMDCSQCRECKAKVLHKMDCSSKELPLLRSERYQLNEKIKQAKIEAESSFHAAIRSCIETVNRADYLSEEQKSQLIEEFYNK